jgi:hypothetical protein
MTDKVVRCSPRVQEGSAYAYMETVDDGNFVRYSDYVALAERVKDLERWKQKAFSAVDTHGAHEAGWWVMAWAEMSNENDDLKAENTQLRQALEKQSQALDSVEHNLAMCQGKRDALTERVRELEGKGPISRRLGKAQDELRRLRVALLDVHHSLTRPGVIGEPHLSIVRKAIRGKTK